MESNKMKWGAEKQTEVLIKITVKNFDSNF